MRDEVYDQMLDVVNTVEAAKDRGVDVTGIVARTRTRMEIDLLFRSGVNIAHEFLKEGKMDNCLAILQEYGAKIDRLTADLIDADDYRDPLLPRRMDNLPLHRDWANHGISCSTCDDGGCPDCTD